MANVLKMAIVQSIRHLHSLQWSRRRIARELGIDRGTVGRCLLRCLRPPNAADQPAVGALPTGSAGPNAATFSVLPAPGGQATHDAASADSAAVSNAAISPTGWAAPEAGQNAADQSAVLPAGRDAPACRVPSAAGRKSECQPWRELIEAKLAQGLSAQRIWQDLRSDHGFPAGYDCVKRFVRRLGRARPLPFRRMEVAPGDEAQADFGAGAPIIAAGDWTRVRRVLFDLGCEALAENADWVVQHRQHPPTLPRG